MPANFRQFSWGSRPPFDSRPVCAGRDRVILHCVLRIAYSLLAESSCRQGVCSAQYVC